MRVVAVCLKQEQRKRPGLFFLNGIMLKEGKQGGGVTASVFFEIKVTVLLFHSYNLKLQIAPAKIDTKSSNSVPILFL